MSGDISLPYRVLVGLAFGISAVFSLVPSYLFGEIFTIDPESGLHRYLPLMETIGQGALFAPGAMLWGIIFAPRFARFDWQNKQDVFSRFLSLGVAIIVLGIMTFSISFWVYTIVNSNGFQTPGVVFPFMLVLIVIFGSFGSPVVVGGLCGVLVGRVSRRYWLRT
ncbi:MAG: hypothetical protein GXP15_09805 [Gammaproteobacteria bacterium]|nr:hypothetical protein [Gammaproteobacteria bacterium]